MLMDKIMMLGLARGFACSFCARSAREIPVLYFPRNYGLEMLMRDMHCWKGAVPKVG